VLAALADHHTRTCRVNSDACILGRTLDDHTTDRGVLQLLLEVLAYADVLVKHRAEGLVIGVPTRAPVAVNREAEANRVNFLSHCDSLSADLDHNVASLLLDTVTAALGAGGKTLQRLTLVDVNRRDAEFIDIGTVVMLGVGNSRLKCFLENAGCLLGRECQDIH